MSNPTRKRGLVAAQPAAAISALDFAAASEAFAAARAKDCTAKDEAEADAIANLIAERADRLIGIPSSNPSQIAEKVNAFLWLHGCTGGDLSDPATQRRIAVSQTEPAKCLLAIYLDLTTQSEAERQARRVWQEAVDRFQDAINALATVPGPVDYDEHCPEFVAFVGAQMALLDTDAPDVKAIAYKLQVVLNYGHTELKDDNTDNPEFLRRALDDHALDRAGPLVRLLRDAYRLAGASHPVLRLAA